MGFCFHCHRVLAKKLQVSFSSTINHYSDVPGINSNGLLFYSRDTYIIAGESRLSFPLSLGKGDRNVIPYVSG